MKRTILTISFLLLAGLVIQLHAQKIISGKSQVKRVTIKPVFTRGLPADLYVNFSFEDDNKNGILEAGESARLNMVISNKGKGPAQGLKITVKDNVTDPEMIIKDGQEFAFIYPDQSVTTTINLSAGMFIKTAEHKLQIDVKEYFGYDMDPAYLMMNTLQFQEPKLEFSGLEIIDSGDGTFALSKDGQIQPGEQVKVRAFIQNIGQNVSEETYYFIASRDENVYVTGTTGSLGTIGIGEVKEVIFTLSPNKRVTASGNLPVSLSVTNSFKRGEMKNVQLPLALNKKPAATNIVKVEADLDRLKAQVARFVFKSDKITTNISNIIEIRPAPSSLTRRDKAIGIVIGIEKYDYLASAPYAANDASLMKDYFRNVLGIDKVWDFTNEKVIGNFFDNKFNSTYGELKGAIEKGETDVFIFYSGHGIPSNDGERVYLLPSDGRIEALERQGYDLNTLYQNLEALNAKSVTVFLDACFSGVSRSTETTEAQNLIASKGARIKPQVNEPWLLNPDFTVFSSSDFDQTSLGFDATETGLFTYYLAAGLKGEADADSDKSITAGELSDYLKSNVMETSVRIRGIQTPRFNGNRELVLVTY